MLRAATQQARLLSKTTRKMAEQSLNPPINAACLIIGDEVLNGKINDTNSKYFARYCFDLGIHLTEICVIGDEEEQIIETATRLAQKNKFIITSGGIGPTHDDITYESLAKVYPDTPNLLSQECVDKMEKIHGSSKKMSGEALKNHYRMATLPSGPKCKHYYLDDKMWVPVVSIYDQFYILPGIPQLFEKLLQLLKPKVKEIYGLKEMKYVRYFVKTPFGESAMSEFLRNLQEKANKKSTEIKIGSYPHWGLGFNTISILGTDSQDNFLQKLRDECIAELQGTEISAEDEEKVSDTRKDPSDDGNAKLLLKK